eukprot:gene17640-23218_t
MTSPSTRNSYNPLYRKFRTGGFEFEVLSRYDIQKFCGYGAFGVVTSAIDTVTNRTVAIKKIMGAMTSSMKCKQTLREIRLMKRFHHENITNILDLIPLPPDKLDFEDLYIVEDLMETDLHRVIYSKQDLSIDHVQCFIYQILRGLKYLHSANVIHRDLKPSNILVNSNCDVKICDFGLSCLSEDETGNPTDKTEYVVTRWYRAPEVMLARQEYTNAIDIWSVGCILAELLNRKPLFPGEDYLKQLEIICNKLGKPHDQELDFITSQRAREYVISLPITKTTLDVKLVDYFPNYKNNIDVIDLLTNMLKFVPSERITVNDSLKHNFLKSMHNPDDEPVADFHAVFDFESDPLYTLGNQITEEILIQRFKQLLWNEIKDFHPNISTNPPAGTNKNTSNTMASPALLIRKAKEEKEYDCSSVATIITNKITSNQQTHGIIAPSNRGVNKSTITPMSPPVSTPNKRLRHNY